MRYLRSTRTSKKKECSWRGVSRFLRYDAQVESETMGRAQGPLMLVEWDGAGEESSDDSMQGLVFDPGDV